MLARRAQEITKQVNSKTLNQNIIEQSKDLRQRIRDRVTDAVIKSAKEGRSEIHGFTLSSLIEVEDVEWFEKWLFSEGLEFERTILREKYFYTISWYPIK